MRNITLLAFLILFTPDIMAQKKDNPFSSANTKDLSIRTGLWFSLGLGPRILDTNPGTINTFFVDDSPYTNSFQSTIEIKDSYTRLACQPTLGFTHPSGLSHTLYSDVTFSKNFVFLFGYSLGWDIPFGNSNQFIVRPAVHGALGNVRFPLGRIENAFEYIEIDNMVYVSNFLHVRLTQGIGAYGPQLDFTYRLPRNLGLTLSLAYDFAGSINVPKASFMPPLNENESNGDERQAALVKLDDGNLNVRYNGNTLNQLPHEYGGFRITLIVMGHKGH